MKWPTKKLFAHKYLLSFDPIGGSQVRAVYFYRDDPAPALPAPTKHGADFVCWTLDRENTQAFACAQMPACDIKLYAKWLPRFKKR